MNLITGRMPQHQRVVKLTVLIYYLFVLMHFMFPMYLFFSVTEAWVKTFLSTAHHDLGFVGSAILCRRKKPQEKQHCP
jgi:hypothetical protein